MKKCSRGNLWDSDCCKCPQFLIPALYFVLSEKLVSTWLVFCLFPFLFVAWRIFHTEPGSYTSQNSHFSLGLFWHLVFLHVLPTTSLFKNITIIMVMIEIIMIIVSVRCSIGVRLVPTTMRFMIKLMTLIHIPWFSSVSFSSSSSYLISVRMVSNAFVVVV